MYIKQLPSGRWRFIVQHQGQRVSGTSESRAGAQRAGAEALLSMGRVPRRQVTVGELLAAHLDGQGYAPTTRTDLARLVERLPDTVTGQSVRDVEPLVVQGWYRRLLADGWTVHRVRKLHMLLSSAWGRAVRYEWAGRNVIRDVDKPHVKSADVHPPTEDELRRVLEQVGGPVALFLRVAAVTGARRGEVLGLQWADVALDTGQVIVRRSVSHTPGRMAVSEGKTGRRGHRVVAVDARSVELLRDHRARQVTLALASGLPAPVWVFSHDAGVDPWRGDYISREFRRACARAGVSGVRLHDLRHFMATSMLSAGVPVTVVAHRLGHSSPTVTLGVYSHYVKAADEDAASGLGALLG